MQRQLTLLETTPDWRIDERTRELGRRGVARARAALADAAGGPTDRPAGERRTAA
ncbi:MAG: hypothetical protein HYX34_13220 [Actinobacteria bacterium]|nr:hypothetical protein [Actinomycetota bacterium]